MTVDVSTKELWSLYCRMSNVIETHRRYTASAGVQTPVVVRWDSAFLAASRIPSDVFGMAILNCLKGFEDLFIKQRHIDAKVLDLFIDFCNTNRNISAVVISLRNENQDAEIAQRFVKCTIQLGDYTFEYWNDDFLPNMRVSVVG